MTKRSMHGLIRIIGGIAALTLTTVSCSTSKPQATSPGAPQVQVCSGTGSIEQPSVTFMADWLPWAVSGPMWAAQEKGYYAAEGLQVKIVAPPEAADPGRLVATNKVQFAISDVPVVIEAQQQGIPLIAVGAPLRHLASGLFSNHESGITSPADLKGKTLGVNPAPEADAYLATLLASAGLSTSDVKVIDPGFGATHLVLADKIAAAYGFKFYEGSLYKVKTGQDPSWLYWTDYGVPDIYQQILITNTDWAKEHPCTTKAFLRATAKGQADFQADYAKYTPILAQHNEVVPLKAQNQMAADAAYDWSDDVTQVHGIFWETADVWQAAQTWMVDSKLVTETLDPNQYFTNVYLTDQAATPGSN